MSINVDVAEWTEAISARIHAQWEAWKNQDAPAHDAVIADGFTSFSPDGIRRAGRSSKKQMREQPISGYKINEFRVLPVGVDSALITCFADIFTPGGAEHHMAVGEFWGKSNGEWFIHAFSGTLMKQCPYLYPSDRKS